MKGRATRLAAALVILCLGLPFRSAVGQTPSDQNQAFPPLESWKSALLNHDRSGLKALYSTNPVARIGTPNADLDADADIAFWLGLHVQRLRIDVKQVDSPQPDLRQLILQMEIHPASSSGPKALYLSAGEVWQRQGSEWRMIAAKRSDAARLEQPLTVSKNIYSPGSDAKAEIKDALTVAAAKHKHVIVVFGANWCYDCHVLDAAFRRPDLAVVLARNYEVVHVDVGRGDKNQDLMDQYQVPMKKGIPGLAVLDSNGKLLASQKNGEFENARALGPEDLLVFLKRWAPAH